MPYNPQENEEEILKYWKDKDVFNRSVNERPEHNPYVFYDGPPFATGMPHYGHIVASTMKDAVPRYWTMKGYRVERTWGWDCHGLPVENLVEKELQLPGKKEIEEFGVGKFNEACRSRVLQYAEDWKVVIERIGRWVDMENDYKTMDTPFMESVWWVFSELYKKGLVYEGKKAMHVCPRCATPLSNFEVSQGYKDIKDMSVTAQFKLSEESLLQNESLKDLAGDVYMLAWTTTPWTLPGNILLAVGEEIEYVCVKLEDAHYILAKELLMKHFEGKAFEVVCNVRGKQLVGLKYEPLFDYYKELEGIETGYRVVLADFVTTEEGTGIVHLAPAFGTDDYEVFKKEGVPFIQHVTIDGRFTPEVTDFAGMEVKQKDDHMATDIEIVKWLAHNGKLFSKEKYTHSYPHCWRCDTPLLNYATSSWFIEVPKIKELLLKNNLKTEWIPESIKEGRFGKWLEGVRDWAVSRNRYWGTPLPIWRAEDGDVICISSVAELESLTGKKVDDLHKHFVDELVIEKNGKQYRRTPEVFDCWFESGAMPYGQMHYPFENKDKFEAGFPAKFIAEGQDQTRGWFYTLHVLATALTSGENPSIPSKESHSAFEHVIVNGLVLAEDGKKMSKRLQNYPDPMKLVNMYGADALRYYLLSSPVMHAENLNFSEVGVREVFNKVVNTVSNVMAFYELFAAEMEGTSGSTQVLDRWILVKMDELTAEVTTQMDAYCLAEAARPIMDFILDLSQWYVRRSRDRMKGDDAADAAACLGTLREVLSRLAVVMAPFTPFIAESMWQQVHAAGGVDSVHLERWPKDVQAVDTQVLTDMNRVRKIVEYGLSLRKEAQIKVRQPLATFAYTGAALDPAYESIIAEELNVLSVTHVTEVNAAWQVREETDIHVALDLTITESLQKEGLLRELVRSVNGKRKEQGLTRDARVHVVVQTKSALVIAVVQEYQEAFAKSVLAESVTLAETEGEEETLNGEVVTISVS